VDVFTSPHGRIGRLPFLVSAAGLTLLAMFYEALTPGALQWFSGWFVYPGLLYCGACLLSKRLHDRGRSGWWAAVLILAVIMVWPVPVGFFDFLALLLLVWAGVELGAMLGEQGTNRFGARPLARQRAG
jgi:uncharacterized membrane protein YhaH (DUF805 family)